MKGVFYNHHTRGFGPYFRSLRICRSLVKEFDVDLIQGGMEIDRTVDSPRFHKFNLPPIIVIPGKGLLDPYGKQSVENILNRRMQLLENFVQKSYDFFFTSFFPFTKLFVTQEILLLISKLKSMNPKCLIISSLNDTKIYDTSQSEEERLRIFQEYYDYVFVHADPSIVRLEDSWGSVEQMKDKIIYTGIVIPWDKLPENAPRQKQILISNGGGLVGSEMVRAAAHIPPSFPDYTFVFALGPHTPSQILGEIAAICQNTPAKNMRILPFLRDFEAELCKSALSISLGGTTVHNVCHTRTPGIAYPATVDNEQKIRVEKFAAKGLITAIYPRDLYPEKLVEVVRKCLKAPYPDIPVDFNGAENTRKELQRLLRERI